RSHPREAATSMAKTSSNSGPLSSSPRPPPSGNLLVAYRALKAGAMVVGLPSTVVFLMALIGGVAENGYARVVGALIVAIVLPLLVADRMLPEHDPTRARGLVGDVCAVTWMLLAVVLAGAANVSTRSLLAREGDRLVQGGHDGIARAAYFLAGVSA